MKPYYEREDLGVTLYHANCLDVVSYLPKGIDLLVTDPPYGISFQSNSAVDREKFDIMKGDDRKMVHLWQRTIEYREL